MWQTFYFHPILGIQFPIYQYHFWLKKNHLIGLKLSAFYDDLFKIHPIYVDWAPLSENHLIAIPNFPKKHPTLPKDRHIIRILNVRTSDDGGNFYDVWEWASCQFSNFEWGKEIKECKNVKRIVWFLLFVKGRRYLYECWGYLLNKMQMFICDRWLKHKTIWL